ncbi:hypothetical protein SH1V18_36910 [Vallitalea longa]|uniref:ABC transporter n=1 Tax=Vallitalea longa TaxID=2936439 RepID=A0A9W5YEI9_9FIRM|nr:ABC transporter permease subunit [Vallitalea longa]GKX31211.1 hypothetical protein SH1V18_36910 [Vallitalea longa]
MNIVRRELRAYSKALIIWSICIILFTVLALVKYEGFAAMGNEANEILESLPDFMKNIFGMASINLAMMKDYYAILFVYYVLIAGIHAVMLGATIISKEARDKTGDFLMVKPVTRAYIITNKVLAGFISILIINIVICLSSIILVDIYNDGESITTGIIYLCLVLFIIQCIFLSIGLAISALTKSSKKATNISTAIILVMYFLDIVIKISDDLNFVKYATPFAYFDPNKVIMGNGINSLYIVLSIIIIVISVIITYTNYQRKDIL